MPKNRLANELASLRSRIVRLQNLLIEPATGVLDKKEPKIPELLDDGPFGIALVDSQHRIVKVNKKLCRMLGYTDTELTSLSLQDIVHEQDITSCLNLIGQVFEGILPYAHIEKRLLKKNKESLRTQFTASITRSNKDKPYCSLAIVEDIIEQKQTEIILQSDKQLADRLIHYRSEVHYRELFENASDIVYTLDLSANITSLNKAAERITGYPKAEALGMKFSQLLAPECQQGFHKMINHLIANEVPTTQVFDITTKNRRRVALEVSNRLIFQQGRSVGIQGIARDITQRKKTEEALYQDKEKLESRIRELQQHSHEMTLLNEMGDILRACLTSEEAYRVIVQFSQDIFPVRVGALYIISPSRNIVESVAVWGDASLVEQAFTRGECWALRRGRVHWVEDTHTGLVCKHLRYHELKGYLCVPMMAQSEALGVLLLARSEDEGMPEAKQKLAAAMAERVAMSLSNLRLHETLRSQSIRDLITGLFNRSFLEESLELELGRTARNRNSLGIIMLEPNNLQFFNENYGSGAGDAILRNLGILIQNNVRKEDIVCRFSHQRLSIILPQANAETTRLRAENLHDLARTLEVKYRGEKIGGIGISSGIAIFPDHGRTVEALARSAEAALIRAKNSGSNYVVSAR